jgi:hypothetical protein
LKRKGKERGAKKNFLQLFAKRREWGREEGRERGQGVVGRRDEKGE